MRVRSPSGFAKEDVSPGFTVEDFEFLLRELRALASKTAAGQRLYLLAV